MKIFKSFTTCLSLAALPLFLTAQQRAVKKVDKATKWFPSYNFNSSVFPKPPISFAPFARWWWPGNNVDNAELIREINLFADHNFGGVEIQALNLFVPGTKEAKAKALTWDTPDYYEHVRTAMEEARKRGMTVDMTDGSGWPPGGSHLAPEDGFMSLQYASADVKTGDKQKIPIPVIAGSSPVPLHLEAVIAAKASVKPADDKSKTILLDPKSVLNLSTFVKGDSLNWKRPAGEWKVIAFWSKPASQRTMTASAVQGPVMNHLDSNKVLKHYRHIFGERTGLGPYFGNPMRAVFDDSYEFAVDRHFTTGFISYFKKHRGYDITPWLPAEMQRGYNYVSYMRPNTDPDFSFSKEDWRLKYDYDLTVSELLGEQFLTATRKWLEPRGLLHRTQAYGLNMDMIAQAGLASIPETESMLAQEANLKIMTSGGHLYNRPVESAESVVFNGRAYTNTPQKIKIAVDKLFAAGVNQIIYHGVPYRYTPDELGPEGWYPFSTPVVAAVNFSSNLGEGNIFWKYQKTINDYVNRNQYALRSGKPKADVLIYFPFMDVDGMPDNPEEILTKGKLDGIEGPLPPTKEIKNEAKELWAKKVYPVINQLEANGITWEWVNDLSILDAKLDIKKQINIRGNSYQALVLANDSIIQLPTAQKINQLAKAGMNLIATGTLPYMQPSYLNWKSNDLQTKKAIVAALKQKTGRYISDQHDLTTWIKGLHQDVLFNGEYHFTRQVQRKMDNGNMLRFIWNKSDQWQTLSLTLGKGYKSSCWLDAENGAIIKNRGQVVTYYMAPYASVILYASVQIKDQQGIVGTMVATEVDQNAKETLALVKWDLNADNVSLKNSPLFDWKTNDQLKFVSGEGIYTTSFQWEKTQHNTHYFLDLGKVYFTAEVYVNGKTAGKRIFAPYQLEITPFLVKGFNKIEVRVTTGQLNGFIGKANQGDAHYKQFKGKEDQLMSAGLVGPIFIKETTLVNQQ
ncbi:glycosyl hydrolase [Mucilaginibacter sp. cycad4]|uniref:glycosyl hydrolase n=1 Tax=Mucilaginibacter sp. cycad4 TaxID=3342096 RepID=UPI002AAB3108|nr:glycosyl hydrolase [Mucilaginibacter gossypii]WPV01945.1 glycosyl hydrolase [Mucilaginibacter gossypii]